MNRSRLSTIIIAKDSATTIVAAIKSSLAVSSQVIVGDTGSTDKTVLVAEQMGATVHKLEWKGYGKSKNNLALSAKNDWILALDSDEYLDEVLINSIQEEDFNTSHIYLINRLTYIGETPVYHSGWHPHYLKRLYYRHNVTWNEAMVHETLIGEYEKTKLLKGLVHHKSFKDMADYKNRQRHYATLRAQEWIRIGRTPSIFTMYLKPLSKFLTIYFFKRGILDGRIGLIIALTEAKMMYQACKDYYKLVNEKNTTR